MPMPKVWVVVALLVVAVSGALYFIDSIVENAVDSIEDAPFRDPAYEVRDGVGYVSFSVFFEGKIHRIRVPIERVTVKVHDRKNSDTVISGNYQRRTKLVEWRDAAIWVADSNVKRSWDRWFLKKSITVPCRLYAPDDWEFPQCEDGSVWDEVLNQLSHFNGGK